MKRAGRLFPRISERANLLVAFHRALRGKRDRDEVRRFSQNLERRLCELRAGIETDSLPLGRYTQFIIHDPKERIITAPCFEERVLHHAIMNVCEPVFERRLIADTYACRKGKGRIAALLRAQQFAGSHTHFLKYDIRHYFDSISHAILKQQLATLFKDTPLLRLFGRIIDGFRSALGKGLPIGSLMSQHFANFHLAALDRFVKETLRIPGYVRYMDDMALWANSGNELSAALVRIEQFVSTELRLEMKPTPYINRVRHGMDFLGCRVFSGHMELNRRSRRRFARGLATLERLYLAGRIGEEELQQRATAMVAFTRTKGVCSWKFRTAVLKSLEVDSQ